MAAPKVIDLLLFALARCCFHFGSLFLLLFFSCGFSLDSDVIGGSSRSRECKDQLLWFFVPGKLIWSRFAGFLVGLLLGGWYLVVGSWKGGSFGGF